MSGGTACKCGSRGAWRIVHYRCNYSAFNGYRCTASDYSLITCEDCGAMWRTKAAYVNELQYATGRR
jgi:hypothetical protein